GIGLDASQALRKDRRPAVAFWRKGDTLPDLIPLKLRGQSHHQDGLCYGAVPDEGQSCGVGCTEGRCDRLDGRILVSADGLSAFPMSVGDLVGDVEDEALVVVELLGCGLALEKFDCIAKML